LELLKDMLQKHNTSPNRNYEDENILCPMSLEYNVIHLHPNDCVS